jgi:hypothetical protein
LVYGMLKITLVIMGIFYAFGGGYNTYSVAISKDGIHHI